MAGKLVGIDLGTTFSAIATLDDRGQPTTLPTREGDMLLPSAVLLEDDGTVVVGSPALDILHILDEPTAAALAYSFQPEHGLPPDIERNVLVYDLGGGTFDVSLVRLSQHRFVTLGIEGDVRLGGKDWDDRIVDHIAAQF